MAVEQSLFGFLTVMNKQHISKLFAGLIAVSGIQAASLSIADQQTAPDGRGPSAITFSWMFIESGTMKPRGGTTSGPGVQLDTRTWAFAGLQAAGLDDRERDRRAILAMAGDYRTSFDFIETIGFTEGYQPQRLIKAGAPSGSMCWPMSPSSSACSTLRTDTDGFESDAMVVKHWRQDWQYECRSTCVSGAWRLCSPSTGPNQPQGAWKTVYQVDDSRGMKR